MKARSKKNEQERKEIRGHFKSLTWHLSVSLPILSHCHLDSHKEKEEEEEED
jgi:hypothetical protein